MSNLVQKDGPVPRKKLKVKSVIVKGRGAPINMSLISWTFIIEGQLDQGNELYESILKDLETINISVKGYDHSVLATIDKANNSLTVGEYGGLSTFSASVSNDENSTGFYNYLRKNELQMVYSATIILNYKYEPKEVIEHIPLETGI